MSARTLVIVSILAAIGLGGWFLFRSFSDRAQDAAPESVTPSGDEGDSAGEDSSSGDNGEPESTGPETDEAVGASIPEPVDLEAADRDLDLFGIVKSEEDQPIPGARIETVSRPWRRVSVLNMEGYSAVVSGPATRSGSDGTFVLRLARGEMVDLRVSAEGHARTVLPRCQAGERVEVILEKGTDLEVMVSGPAGPVGGARVRIWSRPGRDRTSALPEEKGVTDEEGRFVFASLPPGPGFLEVEHDVLGDPSWTGFEIVEPGHQTIDVELVEGRTVTGRVLDAVTQEPVEGARVGANWTLGRAVLTDQDGHYEFLGWTGAGVKDLHVIADGYGRQGRVVPPSGPLDFALVPGDEVQGNLVGGDGKPVGNALVTALGTAMDGRGQKIDTRSTTTNADGFFRLTSLRTDLPHTLIIQARGYGRTLLDFDHSMAEEGVIDLGDVSIPFALSIEGLVVDDSGAALAYQNLSLSGHNADRGRLRRGSKEFAYRGFYGTTEERFTDDIGRFRFPDLSAGTYTLTVRTPGRPATETEVNLREKDLTDVRIEIATGGSLTVRVENRAGEPIPDAVVWLHSAEQPRQRTQARTDGNGEAFFEGVMAEVSIQMRAGQDYVRPKPRKVVPRGQVVRFVLEDAALVKGSVVDPAGDPIEGLEVAASVVENPEERTRGFTGADGAFEIHAPAGAVVDLVVDGTRRLLGQSMHVQRPSLWRGLLEGIVVPTSGLVLRVTEIKLDRELTVLVLDTEGNPVQGTRVRVHGPGISTRVPKTTGADGRIVFEELPADTVRIIPFPGTGASNLPLGAVLPDNQDVVPEGQEIILRYREGNVISGWVLDKEGNPAWGAIVQGTSNLGQRVFASSDKEGRFQFALLSGSQVDLRAHRQTRDGEVPGGGRLEGVNAESGEITIRFDQ